MRLVKNRAVAVEVQLDSATRTTYFTKQKTMMMRWCALAVEGVRSATRSMSHTACGPSKSGIVYCDQNIDGVALSSWYTRQANTNLKQDYSWFGQ